MVLGKEVAADLDDNERRHKVNLRDHLPLNDKSKLMPKGEFRKITAA